MTASHLTPPGAGISRSKPGPATPARKPRWGRTAGLGLLAVAVAGASWAWMAARADPVENLAWKTDYQEALTLARASGQPILLDFTATWCPPCQQMKREVFPKPAISEILSTGFIPAQMDVSTADSPNAPVATQFMVEVLPTLIVVGPDGKVRGAHEGYLSADELLAWLKPLAVSAATQPAPRP